MEKSGRIEYLDLAKGFCIILVVFYHILSFYGESVLVNYYCKLFRMPLYFFLSGIFFKTYDGFMGFLKRKINKLLVPFLFWYLLSAVLLPIVFFRVFNITLNQVKTTNFGDLLCNVFFVEDFPNSAIWFLLCLFEVNILFYFIQFIAHRFQSKETIIVIVCSMVLGICGLVMGCLHFNLPCYIDSSFSALPFFCFGYLANNRYNVLKLNITKTKLVIIALSFFVIVGVCCALGGELHYSLKYNKFSILAALFVYPCGLLGTLAVIMISKVFNHIPVISYWGRFSIIILVTHKLIMQIWKPVIALLPISNKSAAFVNVLLTLLLYLLLIPLLKKIMPHVLAQKDVIPVK